MKPAIPTVARILAVVLALSSWGCGHRDLWARYRAERAYWYAQREVDRIFVNPRVARPSDFRNAEQNFARIVVEFPAARWSRPGGSREAADIVEISGRSTLALARLAELQGRNTEAVARYARVVEDLPHLSGITLEAEVRRAQILERTGDEAGALSAWERVARGYEPVDGAAGEVRVEVLEATGRLARGWEAAGAEARRDSMLEAEVVRLEAAAEKQHGRGGAAGLLDAVGEVQEMRGDLDAARNAWRRALAEPAPDSARARRVLEMGERWLRAERPDSAMAWARWPLGQFFGDARRDALDLQARAWRAVGLPDSALAVYDRILAEFNRDPDATAEARFQRALVLEERDRWMQARAEFSALCASQPTHPRALEAWVRVVTHLEHAGERDMANLEARHALDAMDGLLATQHDEAVRRRVGETRAAVMLAQGKPREAIEALRTVWNVSGLSLEGSALGARVAAAASAELHDEALARSLWQILAERAPDPEIRRQARAQLERRSS